MPKATIKIPKKINRILNMIKAVYDLNSKEEAINFIIEKEGEKMLKKEIRPEYIEKAKKIKKEEAVEVEDFGERYGN